MRIVIVISSLLYGGAETQALALARRLVMLGHTVALYTLNHNNPRAHELDGSGVMLVADQKRLRLDFCVLWRLRRFLRNFRADIVHGFLFDGDVYGRLAAVGTGIPALSSERSDGYSLNRAQTIMHRLTRHLAAGVVANSYAGAAFAQLLYAFPDNKMHVVWNGIALDVVDHRIAATKLECKKEFFGDPSVKVACMVANIKPDKDYLLALEVARQLTADDPTWRVLFVGDALSNTGDYHSSVRTAFENMRLTGRVLFTGLRSDALEIINQCDVLFSTSAREGFPNVVLEAMAVRVPVVSTQYSDIRRILPYEWQVIGSRAPAALAAAITRAYAERESLSSAQRTWVEEHATIAASAAKLSSVYASYLTVGWHDDENQGDHFAVR